MPRIFPSLEARRIALEQIDLYPVISSEFCAGRTPFEVFCAVAAGGARIVQLREKNWSDKAVFELASACRPVASKNQMLLMLDDRIDVALAAGADGVHLGLDDLPLEAARRISGELLLGASTHNLKEAMRANQAADYLNIGPIYATQTKTLGIAPVGMEALREIVPHVHIPYTVMGGIKSRHIPELLGAGARHIAMVTEITQAPDVTARVRELRGFWQK